MKFLAIFSLNSRTIQLDRLVKLRNWRTFEKSFYDSAYHFDARKGILCGSNEILPTPMELERWIHCRYENFNLLRRRKLIVLLLRVDADTSVGLHRERRHFNTGVHGTSYR